MKDHLEQLEQALSDAAVRAYGHGTGSAERGRQTADQAVSRGRWSLRRLPVLVVAAAVLAAATAAAAVVVLGDRGSAPLTGSVPTLRILHYDVSVTPDIEAGHAGWCSYPRFSITGVQTPYSGGGTCSPAYSPGTPILLAGGEPLSNNRDLLGSAHTSLTAAQGNTNLFWAIVSRRVAAIRVQRGLTVVSMREPGLHPGWKAVATFVSGPTDPVPLDRDGRVIRETGAAPQLTRTSVRAYDPHAAGATPCALRASPRPWVTASWQVVATRVPVLGPAVEPNVLFSCARSWYSIKGSSAAASAAILLNARQPRGTAPELPGLTPTDRPGVFTEDGGAGGPILAKRAGRAWLVVQAPSLAIDTLLIGALHAGGSALG